MSLTHTYRTKLAAKQNQQLMGYLVLAIVIHGIGAAGLLWGKPQQWLNFLNSAAKPQEMTPIDFVYVDSKDPATSAPTKTDRRAQTNAAAASRQASAPVQPGKAAVPRITTPTDVATPANQSALLPATPPPSPVQPAQPTPLPSPLNSPFSRRIEPSPIPSSLPTLSPIPASPVSQSPTSASAVPPTRAATTFPTTPLGGPIARSVAISGGGLRGDANADRSGSGSAVDATRDEQWGPYLSALNRIVDQNWQRVAVESTRRTKIQFRVDRQGHLTDLQLVQSSGDTLADQAAMQAIRAAAPFAPLPQNTPEDVLIVNFTFTQWLHPDSP